MFREYAAWNCRTQSDTGMIDSDFGAIFGLISAQPMMYSRYRNARKKPGNIADAEETDVVEQQLAASTHVDDEARREVLESMEAIDEAARQRGRGTGSAT
jgi:hypothetical protein